jgi:hypothetical protein
MTDTGTRAHGEFIWNDQPSTNKCCQCCITWRQHSHGTKNRVKYNDNIDKIDKTGEGYSIVVVATNINNKTSPGVTIGKYINYESFKKVYSKLTREKILDLVSKEVNNEIHPLHRLVVNVIITPKLKPVRQLSSELITEQSTPSKLKRGLSGMFMKKKKGEDSDDFGINIEKELEHD